MDSPYTTIALIALGAAALVSLPKLKRRLELSRAKHGSLTGHSRMARRVASLIPFYGYDEAAFFKTDGAPDEVAARRRAGFMRLAEVFRTRAPKTLACTAETADAISDMQFTDAYRVPFQYSHLVREHLKLGSFLQSSS